MIGASRREVLKADIQGMLKQWRVQESVCSGRLVTIVALWLDLSFPLTSYPLSSSPVLGAVGTQGSSGNSRLHPEQIARGLAEEKDPEQS